MGRVIGVSGRRASLKPVVKSYGFWGACPMGLTCSLTTCMVRPTLMWAMYVFQVTECAGPSVKLIVAPMVGSQLSGSSV